MMDDDMGEDNLVSISLFRLRISFLYLLLLFHLINRACWLDITQCGIDRRVSFSDRL